MYSGPSMLGLAGPLEMSKVIEPVGVNGPGGLVAVNDVEWAAFATVGPSTGLLVSAGEAGPSGTRWLCGGPGCKGRRVGRIRR